MDVLSTTGAVNDVPAPICCGVHTVYNCNNQWWNFVYRPFNPDPVLRQEAELHSVHQLSCDRSLNFLFEVVNNRLLSHPHVILSSLSLSGLDYVSHEDILPYNSTEQVPIQHELFERFLMYNPTKCEHPFTVCTSVYNRGLTQFPYRLSKFFLILLYAFNNLNINQ